MNPYFLTKSPAVDIPGYRAWVVSIGCWREGEGCEGIVHPHHWPPVSEGGIDTDSIPLCAKHHREWHDRKGLFHILPPQSLLDIVKRRLLSGFFLREQLGVPPLLTPDRKRRARGKNLQPLTKKVGEHLIVA